MAGWSIALATTALVLALRRPPLAFEVGPHGEDGRAGEWIAAQDQSVPIEFSDGSELTLSESARARIVDIDADGATVIVERGLLRASIMRRRHTGWRVFVGPFQVRVTGTQFDVAWQPETEHFSLALREGSVVVTGPGLERALYVHPGEELDLSLRGGQQSLLHAPPPVGTSLPTADPVPAPAVMPPAPSMEPPPKAGPRRDPASSELESPRPGMRAGGPRAPDFRELAAANKYRDALAAAERAGFERLCRTATADDVLLLADVARLAGDVERARLAYETVRARFGISHGARAAFFLGRLAFDHDGDYAEAARLFALSMAEQPDGAVTREAAGRLLEAKLRLGDTPGARVVARDYLEHHPDGPHAKLAESLLRAP